MVRSGLTSRKTLWLGQMVPFRGNLSTIIIAIISYILIVNVFAINTTINIIVIISKFLLFSSQRASSQRGRGNLLVKREKREDGRSWRERVTSFECPTNLLLYPDYYTTTIPTWVRLSPPTNKLPNSQPLVVPRLLQKYAFLPQQANYQIPNILLYSYHHTSTLPTPLLLKILHYHITNLL